jgi:prepilin-type N-terminal cleavage/methylation domain-containing protein
MKTHPMPPLRSAPSARRRRAAGFTLVELLTVVTIIVILAGLTIGGLSFFARRQNEAKTKVQLKLLADAIENFKYDYGVYPPLPSAEGTEQFTEASGEGETTELWMALFGDTDNDQILYESDDDQDAYLGELDPRSSNQGWLEKDGDRYRILDGFGTEYRYRKTSDATTMRNPDFDLWSAGADGMTDPENRLAEDSKDDIWEN